MKVRGPFADLPVAHFAAILADPPWYFRCRTELTKRNWSSRRDAAKHYPVLSSEEIAALPVCELAANDAHLFLWTTSALVPQAIKVLEAWGFRYSGFAFTWIKLKRSYDEAQLRMMPVAEDDLHLGLGYTTRKNAEFCLLGRRGNPKRLAGNVREIIMSPVREHSRKPEETFRRIETYCSGPYLELFSRSAPRPGWTLWGDEVGKFWNRRDTPRSKRCSNFNLQAALAQPTAGEAP
jgi:N6-adenosine-specific RNA methylase IME4